MENEKGLQQIQDKDGVVHAYSKWYDNAGDFTWKECTVLHYDVTSERYKIAWVSSGKEKTVGRVNLRFREESENSYSQMIEQA